MAPHTVQQLPAAALAPPARALLPSILPALVVGVGAGLRHAGPDPATTGEGVLWDGVFTPLAASAGALTTTLVDRPTFDLRLPPFGRPGGDDLLATLVIASVAAPLGMCAVRAFPYVHGAFARLGHPRVAPAVGGLMLGLLAAVGGHLTLFKGLDGVGEISADPDGWSAGEIATMTVVKPAEFVGVALGLCAHPAVGVATGVLGVLLAITRQGWVSLRLRDDGTPVR